MKYSAKCDGVRLLAVLLFSVFTGATLFAQSTAQLSGTVRDQSGAVLPGVEVTATQTDTGIVRTVVTNETGSYTATSLPIGPYRLEAALPGFRTYVQTGIVLQVGSNPVINPILEVGRVAETVEVQADAALVETRSTGVGQVIDNTRVLEMPLNGRQVTELILLSGIAVSVGDCRSRGYPTLSISVAGGLDAGLTYNLDGGTHNDPYQNVNIPLPFPDALQEFKVETGAVPAQYGHHSAGAVNAVTKSGTNEFHGNLFEFVRNKVFNARNSFALVRDGLKRNQFGGTLGGPVLRNKLFFFGAYQGTLQRSEPTDNIGYLPTAAMLAGDWTAVASPACNAGRQISLSAPFVNNRIDPAMFSRAAAKMMTYYPLPVDPCGKVQFGQRAPRDEHIVVGKVDYQKSEKHSLFGRYLYARLLEPSTYDGQNMLTFTGASANKTWAHSFVLGDTYLIGAGAVNSFRATLDRPAQEADVTQDFFNLADLGVKNFYYPENRLKVVRINVVGGFNANLSGSPGYTNSTVFQFADDISMTHGSHQLGFGANYINSRLNQQGSTLIPAQIQFTAQQTGMGLGDFMLGKMNTYRQGQIGSYYFRQHYIGAYLQDTWKATSKLTVNAGLRWEPFMSPWEKEGRVFTFDKAWFDQGIRSTVYKKAPVGLQFLGDAQVPDSRSISDNLLLHLAPRLGLAWDPRGDGRMIVRAAYGTFFDLPNLYMFNQLRDTTPFNYRVDLSNPPGGLDDPWLGYPGGNPFPVFRSANIEFPVSGAYVNVPRSLRMPYIQQWNLSLQKQIGADWLVAGNYLGNQLVHLIDGVEANPAVYLPGASCVIAGRTFSPCSSTNNTSQRRELYLKNPAEGQYYGGILQVDSGGTRNYNGMWVSLQRRRARGLTMQANYTWSHCIDDGTVGNFNPSGQGEVAERRKANRGNCAGDRRHNVSASTVYELPQFANATLRVLGSGWRVSGIVKLQSGPYLTVLSGRDNALSGTPADQRPNQVLPDVYAPNKSPEQYLNPSAFAHPALGSYGDLGARNILGPGNIQIDMGLTRTFQIRENQAVEFRAEAFNIPNHVNPGSPVTTLTSSTFGKIQSGRDPRIMQLALKFVF